MKKSFLVSLLLTFAASTVFAQYNKKDYDLKGEVKEAFFYETTSVVQADGTLNTGQAYSNYTKVQFNTQGNATQKEYYEKKDTVFVLAWRETFTYDEQNRPKLLERKDPSGKLLGKTTYYFSATSYIEKNYEGSISTNAKSASLNDKGLMTSCLVLGQDAKRLYSENYKYNTKGELIEVKRTLYDKELFVHVYTYNEQGQVKREYSVKAYREEYDLLLEYDANGQPIYGDYTKGDFMDYAIRYEYDTHNNWTAKTSVKMTDRYHPIVNESCISFWRDITYY